MSRSNGLVVQSLVRYPPDAFMAVWSNGEIRRIGHLVVDLIADHLSRLPDGPVFRALPADLAERFLSTSAPVDGAAPDDILREFRDQVEPYPFGNGHPRFWGWVNSPPAVMGFEGGIRCAPAS